jgi:hypothetical protein
VTGLSELLLAKALAEQEQAPADLTRFQRLVGSDGPLSRITSVCFLLYRSKDKATHDPWTFLEQVAPRLLAQLHRSTHPQRVQLRGRARGSVDWAGTVRARAGASQDSTIFVCRQSWRLYDLPENQLLKYLLRGLLRCQERSPREARTWMPWRLDDSVRGGDQLALVAHRLRRYRRNAYLRDVAVPSTITVEHQRAARTARNRDYRTVAEFYDTYSRVIETPVWEDWTRVVRQGASLLPAGDTRVVRQLMH